jgi:hypothetical protein
MNRLCDRIPMQLAALQRVQDEEIECALEESRRL